MWDPSSQPGIKPAPPALECEVLTTGPSGKSLSLFLKSNIDQYSVDKDLGKHSLGNICLQKILLLFDYNVKWTLA